MSEKIVQLNEEVIKGQLKEMVRGSVEETLNELLEQEAEKLIQAARYERSEARQGYRSGHYDRNLTTTSGDVTLQLCKRQQPFYAAQQLWCDPVGRDVLCSQQPRHLHLPGQRYQRRRQIPSDLL